MITDIRQLDLTKLYTYADYLTWKFPERVELIFGKVFAMSPAPRLIHQDISISISSQLHHHFKSRNCKVYAAPVDLVIKSPSGLEETVLQPDLVVVCTPPKPGAKKLKTPPDLVMEILSKSTQLRDKVWKFGVYESFGVKEYWIIDPMKRCAEMYFAGNSGKFVLHGQAAMGESIRSRLFPELVINLDVDCSSMTAEPQLGYGFRELLAEERRLRRAVRI